MTSYLRTSGLIDYYIIRTPLRQTTPPHFVFEDDGSDEAVTTQTNTPSQFASVTLSFCPQSLSFEHFLFMDSLLSLTYVDIRGLAEPINLILVDANVNHRDERIPLSQWNNRKLEGTYGPVYGQPFHDLPTLSVKTPIGSVVLAGIFTILEYLEDAFDIYAGKDVLYKAKINMIRDASLSFLLKLHDYLGSEAWDTSEERAHFREQQILPFLLDMSRHIGVNGVQGDFGADPRQPLTAAGACIFEALDLIEQFFPAALNDWPVLAITRGRISIRPNIKMYLREGKRPQKVSMSPYETPERVAYLSLRDINIPQQSRQSEVSGAASIYSAVTSETTSVMPGSPPRPVLKKKRRPSSHSVSKHRPSIASKGESEPEGHRQTLTSKNDDASSKRSVDVSEGRHHRSRSFTDLFIRRKSSKTKLQLQSNDSMVDGPKNRDSRAPDGDNRSVRSIQQGPFMKDIVPDSSPLLLAFPRSTFAFPVSGDNVRSSAQSDSVYSNSSGPEYIATVVAI